MPYRERWRPQFHFTPERNWMNDPNGLVFLDGEFHLFYQYNPFGDTWGHMSWGHAVSPDLVHWEHLPVALAEEGGVMIFSGSAVIDVANTSGFGAGGVAPMVAIYTGHHTDMPLQTQDLAFSLGRGRTWTKYAGNPVLDIGAGEFRDPKVFWHEPDRCWVMVVALPDERMVQFYGSPDLKDWALLGGFGPAGSTDGIWECPDLFRLPVEGEGDGEGGERPWVLVVNVATGAPAGGSGTQYFVGRFDGTRFIADDIGAEPRWADFGRDFYAAVSWSGVPPEDGRRIWIGWMSNWDYAAAVPTSPWRSAMTVPRSLGLRRTPDGLRLIQQPVAESADLRTEHHEQRDLSAEAATAWLAANAIDAGLAEIELAVRPGATERFTITLRHGEADETTIAFDFAAAEVTLDRRRSGEVAFAPSFPGVHRAPFRLLDGRLRVRILVDASSVEVFVNDGETVLTDLILPLEPRLTFEVSADSPDLEIESIDLWSLRSATPTSIDGAIVGS
jgi:fructan beta-fructosidase